MKSEAVENVKNPSCSWHGGPGRWVEVAEEAADEVTQPLHRGQVIGEIEEEGVGLLAGASEARIGVQQAIDALLEGGCEAAI